MKSRDKGAKATGTTGVALIGAVMIAKTHVSALSAAQETLSLKAVVSRRPENATYLAELYGGPPPEFTADLDALSADPEINFAIVGQRAGRNHRPVGTSGQTYPA